MGLLQTSPNVGNVPKEMQEFAITEFRELHGKPFRIVYHRKDRQVWVAGIFDGRRNMKALLHERLLRK